MCIVSHYSNLMRCNLTACVSRIQEANLLACDVAFTYLHAADGMCIISNGQKVRLIIYSVYHADVITSCFAVFPGTKTTRWLLAFS